MEKIVFIRGLWSSLKAVEWIKNNLESSIGSQVELFDYHDILTQNIDNQTYVKLVLEKYCDLYGSSKDISLIGHSHGGTIATLISEACLNRKLVLVNPAFRPWGVFRRIPNAMNKDYQPHFIVKYDGEVQDRIRNFAENFRVMRDTSRVFYTGSRALERLNTIKSNLLLIQSMKDEFVSSKVNLDFYNNLPSEIVKKHVLVENGEHAVLEERGEYPRIYKKIAIFIREKTVENI